MKVLVEQAFVQVAEQDLQQVLLEVFASVFGQEFAFLLTHTHKTHHSKHD